MRVVPLSCAAASGFYTVPYAPSVDQASALAPTYGVSGLRGAQFAQGMPVAYAVPDSSDAQDGSWLSWALLAGAVGFGAHQATLAVKGKTLADFKATTNAGKEVSLADYKKKPVLISNIASL
jgi:hypothetical protein